MKLTSSLNMVLPWKICNGITQKALWLGITSLPLLFFAKMVCAESYESYHQLVLMAPM